jgi:hypothetical protein
MENVVTYVRTRFLKKFTEEIIYILSNRLSNEEKQKIENLRQELISSFKEQKEPIYVKEINPVSDEKLIPSIYSPKEERRTIVHRKNLPLRYRQNNLKKLSPTSRPPAFQRSNFSNKEEEITQYIGITPEYSERPENFSIGKLNGLLKDPSIQTIECPGPNKYVLIKRYNKMNITRIILNQTDIRDIINNFANQAKIPVVGGILKAAVGNLMISAFDSEYAGSRFVISKITPFA